jgi:KUP system potassium uptake protein
MVGTVIVTAVYSNTTRLGNAYGVCVIFVTFLTTNMITLVALIVWKLHWLLVLAVWLPFVTLDGLFLSAALTKVPGGAWFTILLAILLSSICVLWRYGKEKQWHAEGRGRYELTQIVNRSPDGGWCLAPSFGGRDLTSIKGIAVFFDKAGDMVPTVYEEFLRKFEARPDVEVFLHLRALTIPHVSEEEKFSIARTSLPNCYRMIVRHGYNDIIVTEGLGDLVYQELRKHLISSHAAKAQGSASGAASEAETSDSAIHSRFYGESRENADARLQKRLDTLDEAYKAQTVYIVGKEQLRLLRKNNNWFKRAVLEVFLWIRDNTRAKVASMKIPIDKLVEVGFVKEI